MFFRRGLRGSLLLALTLTVWACGDDSSDPTTPDPNPTDEGEMVASVDGVPWAARASSVVAEVIEDVPGGYEIRGTQGTSQILVSLYNIDAPGTYPLGVNPTVFGGYASYATSGRLWHSTYSGASGTVTVTALTSSRIAGTFAFTATPFPGTQATGTLAITAGEFDAPIEGTPSSVPDAVGGSLTATLDGSPYRAAFVLVTGQGTGDFLLTTSNDDYTLAFFLGAIDGPGVYPLAFGAPPVRSIVINPGSAPGDGVSCCWGPDPGDVGSVTVTSLTADRLVGTFAATLVPRAGTEAADSLHIAEGAFDLGLAIP